MQQGLDRCEAYIDTSRAEFKQSGLPEDLVWLAQVESVWKQGAQSRVSAGGIWQFMPRTAADYGLVVESRDDERFNPAKETRAAATYLRDLYTLFGSWELAMAAYNCGEPRLMDAIVRCGQPDFWALYDRGLLPRETSNYVPKILAAIKVASDPDNYAFAIERVHTDSSPVATGP
jgi:membrane-bound lytic murein transglycosylase D